MPYITRDDGERFVIPSYRDVISAKKQSLLKREVLLLSSNYGDYITLHRKNIDQYEVAFSPDIGYLLGETVWHYFKRPLDLVYCEAIPNTSEAILVVVKSGSVYLDGSFSLDAIADELLIFRTQQNNFDIYIYGDVPISQAPESGKFTFDTSSVRSFQQLQEPAFPLLPKVKNFHLQPVNSVLKSQHIGILPIKQMATILIIAIAIWGGWEWLSLYKKELPTAFQTYVNPYQVYLDSLTSPSPDKEIQSISNKIQLFYSMPGWTVKSIEYSKGQYRVAVKSDGTKSSLLFDWAKQNGMTVEVATDGFYITATDTFLSRPVPQTINKLSEVIAHLVDRLATILPGNRLQLTPIQDRRSYQETNVTITFNGLTPDTLALLGLQLKNLPLVLNKVSVTMTDGGLSGSIILQALGY